MLLLVSALKTSYLVLMTLRTSHLNFNGAHLSAVLVTSVLTLMATRKALFAALRTRPLTSKKNAMLHINLRVALGRSAVSAVHFDRNLVCAFSRLALLSTSLLAKMTTQQRTLTAMVTQYGVWVLRARDHHHVGALWNNL